MDMFDEARAIKSTMELCHLTQSELASQLGVSQSYVANKLRLLNFSEEIAEKIRSAGLTERHARSILRLESTLTPEELSRLIDEVRERELTVRECEALVDAETIRRIPERLRRSDALSRIDDLSCAIAASCDLLCSQGLDARSRSRYLGPDLYITVVIKNA